MPYSHDLYALFLLVRMRTRLNTEPNDPCNHRKSCTKFYHYHRYTRATVQTIQKRHVINYHNALIPQRVTALLVSTLGEHGINNEDIANQLKQLNFGYKLDTPIGLKILNNKRANHGTILHGSIFNMPQNCPCKQLFPAFIDETIGHVRGIGCDILKDTMLHSAISKGLNTRIPFQHPNKHFHSTFRMYWKAAGNTLLRNKIYKKRRKVLRRELFTKVSCLHNTQSTDFALYTQMLDQLAFYQKHLLLSRTDKASNLLSYECINYHRLQLSNRVNSDNFLPTSITYNETAAILRNKVITFFRKRIGWRHEFSIPLGIPSLTTTTKWHKQPPSYRFLSPSQKTTFAPVSVLIGQILRFLLWQVFPKVCEQREEELFQLHGTRVKLMWAINRMSDFLLSMPDNPFCLHSADIEKCYEKPPLTEGEHSLLSAMKWFTEKCFRYVNRDSDSGFKGICYSVKANGNADESNYVNVIGFDTKRSCAGLTNHYFLNHHKLLRLYKFQLCNFYIRVGDAVFRQKVGIGMGLHSSSDECDIYFTKFEYQHVERSLRLGAYSIAAASMHRYRYQDDIASVNAPTTAIQIDSSQPQSEHNPLWIYPLHLLNIKETMVDPPKPVVSNVTVFNIIQQITFLSTRVTIYLVQGQLKLNLIKYNKMEELPFYDIIPKYTHGGSYVPKHTLHNPIHSQLSVIATTCSTLQSLVDEAVKLVRIMIDNKINVADIKHNLELWLTTTLPHLPLTYDVTSFAHALVRVLGW